MAYAINIKALDKPGVLRKVTEKISKSGVNITYTHLFMETKEYASTYLELEGVEDLEDIVEEVKTFPEVFEVKTFPVMDDIYGKRIIIIGGGAQVSQVAMGAIIEADRHNIRGERISVDTIPLAGEDDLADAVAAVGCLPRVGVLVLAGSLMGGRVVDSIEEIREKHGVKVISLNMIGSVRDHVDLIVTDPVQAGVMAVMTVASTAKFDIDRVNETL